MVDVTRRFHKLELAQKYPIKPENCKPRIIEKLCNQGGEISNIFFPSLVIDILVHEKTVF